MKKRIWVTLVTISLLLVGCTDKQTNIFSKDSSSQFELSSIEDVPIQNSTEKDSFSSEKLTSLNYKVQVVPQETSDKLSADEFCWGGRGCPTLSVKWVNQDKLLFFVYRIDAANDFCRIFSYIPSTNTTTQLAELSGKSAESIEYFFQGDTPYLLWNQPNSPQLYPIGGSTSEVKQIEPFMGYLSPNGEIAVIEWESPIVTLQNFLNPKEQHIEFQKDIHEEFTEWSPDGQYLTFIQSKDKRYTIYDHEGNFKQSILANRLHWCKEPNFLTVYAEDKWKLLNVAENTEFLLPDYPEGTILLQEPDFALIKDVDKIVLLNHHTGEITPIGLAEIEKISLVFTDYNCETGTVALACWIEVESHDKLMQWPTCYLISIISK